MREEIAAAARRAGRAAPRPRAVEVLAATKYVAGEELPVLAEAGVRLVGENRAQDLREKVAAHGGLFEWDFIGPLQSRKVRLIVPHVRLIHSVASESALRELRRHARAARPGPAAAARGQRRRRGGQGGHRAGGDRRASSRAARSRSLA